MRRIKIDFLTPADTHGVAVKWVSAVFWLSGVAFTLWQIGFARQLLEERETLSAQLSTGIAASIHTGGPIRSAHIDTFSNKSWLKPRLLAGLEDAVGRVRGNGEVLLLDRLFVDANIQRLTLRGTAHRPSTVDRLTAELRAGFPQAQVSFPNIRNTDDGTQFEVSLNFPATGAEQ
jgi:hypothetical protein